MPHPKPAEGNVALISPPEGAVAAAAPAPEADDRWVWFEDEHGERFRVPRSWVQGAPADASNAGGSAEEADPDEAGGIHIKNPTLSRMFEGVRLTPGQASLVPKLQAFLDDDDARIFILRGYAGTGKTFLMKGVVDYLSAVNRSVHLMAPTGRAAKVLSTRTSRSASTIHAHLYSPRDRDDPDDEDFTLVSDLTSNTDELDAVYVVDEASMVSDRETQNPLLQFGSGRLLADLLHFLEDAPCAHRRHILFVGDAAQLPPVGMTVSPALSPVHLEEEFGLKPSEHTLTDIVRQKQDSGILALATALRTGLKNKTYALPRLPADVPDVERIDARDMARLCWEVMGRRITRDAVMIAQTNVRAQQLNRAFRRLQFPGVEELAAGDKLIEPGLRQDGRLEGTRKAEFARVRWLLPEAPHLRLHPGGVHEAELDAFGVEGLHPDGKRSDPGEPDIKVGAELPDGLLELAPVRFAVRAQPLRSAVLLSEDGIGHRVMERIEFVIAHDGERRTRLDHAAHDFKRAADFGPAVDEVAEKDHTATFWMPQDAVRLLITHALEENRQFRGVPVHVADDVKA